MNRLKIAFVILLVATPLFAVSPQSWIVSTTEEFLAGDLVEGFAVTARGELRPGPLVRKLVSVSDPFVLSQAVAPDGTIFLGTGNGGRIYRLKDKKLELLYTAAEPEIYAVALSGGKLYAGSSPNGKIYEIDPKSGAAKEYFDPKQAYIWALAPMPDGSLLAGTGIEGKIFRISGGKGDLFYDAPEMHIRSLAVAGPNRVLAGGAGEGRIYEIDARGVGRALYDSTYSEITAVYFDAKSGTAWAAGVTTTLPTTAPARAASQQSQQSAQQGSAKESDGKKQEGGDAAGNAEVTISFDEPLPQAAPSRAGSSEVYRIGPDGFVQTAWKFEKELVYALGSSDDGRVYIATGPNGRIYTLEGGDLALAGSIPEKQTVSIARFGNKLSVTTTNAGAVYDLDLALPDVAEIRSPAQDLGRFSSFGAYKIEGRNLDTSSPSISFRSGNTTTPDDTWSAWTAPVQGSEGTIAAPPARFLQWRLSVAKPRTDLVIESVSASFMNRNVAPVIEGVAVLDPGVVFVSAAYPSSPQVLEATNPDDYGIFNSLDTPRERSDPGKRMFRKGYRTITWRAKDENGDAIRYDVQFRRAGSEKWLRLRENMDMLRMNFDSGQLPDGRYEIRLTASDAPGNPGSPLTDTREGFEFVVDNTPPRVAIQRDAGGARVSVTDALSPIVKAEYSVDAKEWIRLTADDGIADSLRETFTIPATPAGSMVVVRVVDGQFNVATASVSPQ